MIPPGPTFTAYVKALTDPHGEPLGTEVFEALSRSLRASLATELRKRQLWSASPRHLGILGYESWRDQGALTELVADCYVHIFVDRLRSLKGQLLLKPNIDGLVFLNIRNFLHERQKFYDPLGYRVFQLLRSAVEDAVSSKELLILSENTRIRNNTLLGWSAPVAGTPLGVVETSLVQTWADGLCEFLLAAKNKARMDVVTVLRVRIRELRHEGIDAFLFGDLIQPLRNEVRARWAAVFGSTCQDEVEPSPWLADGWIARQGYEQLTSCVEKALHDLEFDSTTSRFVSKLWNFIRLRAEDTQTSAHIGHDGKGLPSQRQLAEALQIPRHRLPELFEILQDVVSAARRTDQKISRLRARHHE